MLPQRTGATTVPSKNALRVLRQLALAGSTLGSVCAVAAITYDVHRRVGVAEQIIENKRTLQTSAPYYNATSAARKLSRMLEAAEAGEFDGLASLKDGGWSNRAPEPPEPPIDSTRTEQKPEQRISKDIWQDNSAHWKGTSQERTNTNSDHTSKAWLKKWSEALSSSMFDAPPSAKETKTIRRNPQHTEVNKHLRSQDLISVRELFGRRRFIEAAEMLLEKHLPERVLLSPETKDLAVKLFNANCYDGNVFMARRLFNRLEAIDEVSPRMWEALIVGLAKSGAVESTAQLYLKYSDSFELPPSLIEVILRCLLESQRLRHASQLIYRSIRHDRDCGLCGIFLSLLWKKTRSIDALNQQLEKILAILPRFQKYPTEKLFNPVLRAYVQFGRVADAHALAADMQKIYKIPVSCRTKGILLYAEALACNWAEVEQGFQEMHELGLTADQRNFSRIFDSIFLEFWPGHNAAEIHDFFLTAVENYSLVPDRVLYKHVLQAYVEKGSTQYIENLIELGQICQWKIKFDEEGFVKMLQHRRRALEHSPVGFWQLMNAARIKYGQAAFSQQILGHDQRSVPHAAANLIPHKTTHPNWYRRMVLGVQTNRPLDQYMALDKQMAQDLHAGNPHLALEAFENAKVAKYSFKTTHVELAIMATLVGQDGLLAAQKLIREHWEVRRPVVPKFFSQVAESDLSLPEIEVIKMAVFRFYNLCWEEPNLLLKHHFMISLASRLLRQRKNDAALDLLITVYKSRWARQVRFDGICMKHFIRAFTAAGNLKGVRWCILTSLSRDSACNASFIAEMRRSIALLHIRLKDTFREQFLKRRLFLDHLETLADMVEKKSKGDPEMATLRSKVSRKRFSGHFQPQLHKWHDSDFENIKQIVETWEEELELDNLIKPQGVSMNGKKALEQWNESNVVQEGDEFFFD